MIIYDLFMLYRFYQIYAFIASYCFCSHDTVFDAYFLIQIYRYTCAYLCMPLGTHLATHWGVFLTLLDLHIQILKA